jgi:hypothetical protein
MHSPVTAMLAWLNWPFQELAQKRSKSDADCYFNDERSLASELKPDAGADLRNVHSRKA